MTFHSESLTQPNRKVGLGFGKTEARWRFWLVYWYGWLRVEF